ncbi:hypothetical protein ACQP3J_28165, partial [Escherichia coli]
VIFLKQKEIHTYKLLKYMRWISEFENILVYRASSRTARATQRNPVSKNKTKQANKQTNKQKTPTNQASK